MIPEAVLAAAEELAPIVLEALTKGVSKETLMDAIKALMTEASDAEMHREFPQG